MNIENQKSMAEYIERDAFKAEVRRLSTHYLNEWDTLGVLAAADRIPAADVAPVRHGQWIWDDEGYHCSECFYHAYGETGEVLSGNWHYCPNCGARMDGDGE